MHLVLEAEGGRAISAAQAALAPAISQRDTGAVIAALNQLATDVAPWEMGTGCVFWKVIVG